MQWLFLTIFTLNVVTLTYAHNYLECDKETDFNPGLCNCAKDETTKCFINLTITKATDDDPLRNYSINGERMGPTIIAKYNQLVVVDVYNKIDVDISIHWHGMHQWNTAFMDGVAMITQWPTKPREAFRHVFLAKPAGTHWYHSHVLDQREHGIVGALIVRDEEEQESQLKSELGLQLIDEPEKRMLAIRENVEEKPSGGQSDNVCEPDESQDPLGQELEDKIKVFHPFRINGVPLASTDTPKEMEMERPTFHVNNSSVRSYRFRIVGIMSTYVIRFSISKHQLKIISADGYLTKPYTVDYLVVHVGERYDFTLKPSRGSIDSNENVFPIRIETVALVCNGSKQAKVSYAFLEYKFTKINKGYEKPCQSECKVLNCPFKEYADGSNYICHSVEKLQLLNPAPEEERLPTGEPDAQYFFNFGFRGKGFAAVNNVSNVLPTNIPFTHPPDSPLVENKCDYDTPQCNGKCAHAVKLEKAKKDGTFKVQKIRFVLSSIKKKLSNTNVKNVVTHPIHLHGHSFFVAKIGYPKYNKKGHIIKENKDLTISDCGHAKWTADEGQEIAVNTATVRKDVIIVPAGGYVVIEFLADNPGWWFLHCHIDGHLNAGMAIALDELPECRNNTLFNIEYNPDDPYASAEKKFNKYQSEDKCNIRSTPTSTPTQQPTPTPTQPKADNRAREANFHNMRQEYFDPVVNMNRDNQFASPFYKRLLHQRFRAQAADPELRRFEDIRQRNEHAPEWNK